jgi:putative PEP-CTERM system TPR-repeat lipoprotein
MRTPAGRSLATAVLALSLVLTACGASTPEELLAEARQAAEKRDYRTAAIQLKSLLSDAPENVDAVLLLADVSAADNNSQLAERNYRRAAELKADPSRYWRGWVDALLVLGQFDDALARLDEVKPATPADEAAVLVRRSRALRAQGKVPEAEVAVREAVAKAPSQVEPQVELGDLLFVTGRRDESRAATEAALQIDPGDPDALMLKALQLLAGPEPATAAPVLAQVIDRAKAMGGKQPLHATALSYLIELDLAAKQTDSAATRVTELVKLVGQSPQVRYLRARVAVDRNDLAAAKQDLQDALAAAKDYLPARRLLGAINVVESQYELAEMNLRPVVKANPDDVFARRLLANVLLARRQPGEALSLLDTTAVADGEAREMMLAMAGQASLQTGDVARASDYFREGAKQYPENPAFELGLALTLLAEGRTDEAEKIIRDVKGEQAEAARAAFDVILLMQKGQVEQAVTAAKAAVEKFPDVAWSNNLLGSVLIASGDFKGARQALVTATEKDPNDAASLANLARVEQLLGNPDAAAGAWRRILTADPTNADAAGALARLEVERGNLPEALKVLEPFRGKYSRAQLLVGAILLDRGAAAEARKIGEEVLKTEPDNPEALNLVGLAEFAAGDPMAGAARFRRAIELQPGVPIYRLNLTRALLTAGDPVGAEVALADVRKLAPNTPQLLSVEAAVALAQRKPEEARKVLNRMEADQIGDARLRAALDGEVLAAEGKLAEASQRFTEAYRLGPNLDSAVRAWGAAQAAGQKPDPALLDDWLKRNPDDVRAQRVAGDLFFAAGLKERAQRSYENILEFEPRDLAALNNLAWIYQENGDSRALQLADRALKVAPDNPAVLDTAGWAQLRLGDKRRGAELIEQAAAKAPDDPDIQYHRAVALIEGGKRDEGRAVLEQILGSDRPFPSRDEAAARLKLL